MLKNFFDVNTEDIANAVFRQYGDVNKIKQAFKEALSWNFKKFKLISWNIYYNNLNERFRKWKEVNQKYS